MTRHPAIWLLVRPKEDAGVEAALSARPDAIVVSLVDAIGQAAGLIARVRAAASRPRALVRISPLASGRAGADLDAVMKAAPDAIVLPRAVGGRDVQRLGAMLAVREAEHGLADGSTGIVAVGGDSAAGVMALGGLAGSSPRLVGVGCDPVALATDLGVGGAEILQTARALTILAARAAGVQAIVGPAVEDAPWDARIDDGFDALMVRRPDDVAACREAVRPASGVAR